MADPFGIPGCHTCRFALLIDKYQFQCAARPDGWAYVWRLKDRLRNPGDGCERYIGGAPHWVGHELRLPAWQIAAAVQVRPEDREIWTQRGLI